MDQSKDSSPLPLYYPNGIYGFRAPALSIETIQAFSQHIEKDGFLADIPTGSVAWERRYRDLLQQGYALLGHEVFSSPNASFIQTALAVASRDIYEAAQRLRYDSSVNTSFSVQHTRLWSRLLRYLIRISTRTTPFGLFSGISLGYFAKETNVVLHAPAITSFIIRPDIQWFLVLLQHLEDDSQFRSRLVWRLNETATIIGNHMIVLSTDIYGQHEHHQMTARAVPLLRFILEHFRGPITYSSLVERILHTFSQLHEEQLHTFLQQLWDMHLFQSTLAPALLCLDPLKKSMEQFPDEPSSSSIINELSSIQEGMAKINQRGIHALTQDISRLLLRQQQVVPTYTSQPFQVDATLNIEPPILSMSIAETAAKAAEILLKMGNYPTGKPSISQYRQAFLQKYGSNREVKLLDLVLPEEGLGFPLSYATASDDVVWHDSTSTSASRKRSHVLCHLYTRTMNSPERILVLTDDDVEVLSQWKIEENNCPPLSLDLFVQVQAHSQQDIEQGTWEQLIVHSMRVGGGSMSRFAHLFDEQGREALYKSIRQEEALLPECIFADLSYLPSHGVFANVAIRPPFHPYEIAVHTTPTRSQDYVLSLHDLVIGVRDNRFYVRSLRLNKEVKIFHRNMLVDECAPNICRLLLDVTSDGCPLPHRFDWAILSQSPFLPRVLYGKIILRLAQWRFSPLLAHNQKAALDASEWFVFFQQWRKQWHVPRYVHYCEYDNRLLLDLEHPLMVHELFQEFKKLRNDGHSCLLLQEMLPDFDHLWLRDDRGAHYTTELTIPVVLNARHPHVVSHLALSSQRAAEITMAAAMTRPLSWSERRSLPDSLWTYLSLVVDAQFQDEIIAGPLRSFIQTLEEQRLGDRWFYLRYSVSHAHIRLRVHASSLDTKKDLLFALVSWASLLVRQGAIINLSVESYDREIERYGGPEAIDAIEHIFCANSSAICAVVAAQHQKQITLDPLIVAVLCLDHFLASCGYDFPARRSYLHRRVTPDKQYEHMETFRLYRSLLTELCVPWRMPMQDLVMTQRSLLFSVLNVQIPIIEQQMALIRSLEAKKTLWAPVDTVIGSLTHMLINRLCGIDRDVECKAYALWRHTLDAIQKRPYPS